LEDYKLYEINVDELLKKLKNKDNDDMSMVIAKLTCSPRGAMELLNNYYSELTYNQRISAINKLRLSPTMAEKVLENCNQLNENEKRSLKKVTKNTIF
jgi:hypothetical protein